MCWLVWVFVVHRLCAWCALPGGLKAYDEMRESAKAASRISSDFRNFEHPIQALAYHFRFIAPWYSANGRMMRLFWCCSMMCAHQPVMRAATKIGVYCGTGMPMMK